MTNMDDPDGWVWVWLWGALFFALGEIATPVTFFLLPFAVGALLAALLAFLDVGLAFEWAAFVIGSLAAFLALRPLGRRLNRAGHDHGIGSRRLVGQEATVLEDIPGTGDLGLGLVRVGREEWRAESTDGRPIPSGAQVLVADIRGTRVVVSPRGTLTSGDGAR
jgi:membrane protein implicated in regulation of membrane protease activity